MSQNRTSGIDGRAQSVAGIVRRLYTAVEELEALFPGRRFTPDGHLVGSIGEALGGELYGLRLLTASSECHDACTADGRLVQIKATQGNRAVALYSEPEHLLVFGLRRDGGLNEIYNGPGAPPWNEAGKRQKNGQRQVSLATLRRLMLGVPDAIRLPPAGLVEGLGVKRSATDPADVDIFTERVAP